MSDQVANLVRCQPTVYAYLEGVAAVGQQKEKTLQVIQKYTRLQDPKLIQELYADGVKFLERVPRMDKAKRENGVLRS